MAFDIDHMTMNTYDASFRRASAAGGAQLFFRGWQKCCANWTPITEYMAKPDNSEGGSSYCRGAANQSERAAMLDIARAGGFVTNRDISSFQAAGDFRHSEQPVWMATEIASVVDRSAVCT